MIPMSPEMFSKSNSLQRMEWMEKFPSNKKPIRTAGKILQPERNGYSRSPRQLPAQTQSRQSSSMPSTYAEPPRIFPLRSMSSDWAEKVE